MEMLAAGAVLRDGPWHERPRLSAERKDTTAIERDARQQQKLDDLCKRLKVVWAKFTNELPLDERSNISHEPNLSELMTAVQDGMTSLTDKRRTTYAGKAQMRLENIMARINDHRELLSVVPTDDKYVAAIAGSVTILAKAIVNHQTIGEAILDALDELHDDLDYWKRQMTVHQGNDFMYFYIIELYVIIFEMFTDIFTGWIPSKWKRALHSLDSQWVTKAIANRRERIKLLKNKLENEAKLASEAVLLHNLATKDDMYKALQHTSMDIVSKVIQTLSQQPHSLLPIEPKPALLLLQDLLTPKQPLLELATAPATSAPIDNMSSALAIFDSFDLSFLSEHAHHEHQKALIDDQCDSAMVDRELNTSLDTWFQSSDNTAIWIETFQDYEDPNQGTDIHLTLAKVLKEKGIPVVSYVCNHLGPMGTDNKEYYRLKLLATISGFCETLWKHCRTVRFSGCVPDDIVNKYNAFWQCQPRTKAIPAALDLLQALLRVRLPLVVCMIDNIAIYENRQDAEARRWVRRLMDLLLSHCGSRRANDEAVVKLCMTTNNACNILNDLAIQGRITRVPYERSRHSDEELSITVQEEHTVLMRVESPPARR